MDDVLVDNHRLEQASRVISSAAKWSAGAGLIPIPLVDIGAVAAVQVRMANDIARVYGQSFAQEPVKSTIAVLLGTLLPSAGTGLIASGVKMIPGVGSLLGIVTFPALASAATYAMGRVLVRHFETGGSTADFTPDRVQSDLKREFAATKTTAKAT